LEDHLLRHQLADLFLDTFPYNAHTTASDSLWAGLPVLTYMGETFSSRVAASMLYASDMGELVVENLVNYEELALKIAKQSDYLNTLKSKLQKNKKQLAVFDTQRYTENLEKQLLRLVK
jgi:predicted O-linked N-acetylglucosamine transferase (SPINDLY family)